jgi:hypothetical protein
MKPIDVAEKWARAARTLYFEGRHASDPLAVRLDTRTRAHYGEAYEHSLESLVLHYGCYLERLSEKLMEPL